MSKISIQNWKQTSIEGSAFELIPPVYHVTYWEVPKWWYRGDRTVYTSCVRVDVNDATSVYIDGTTPLMQITIDWDDNNTIRFENVRDIRRILILGKDNYGPVIRGESDAYTDVEFFQGNNYTIRYDNYFGPNVIQPLQKGIRPTWVDGNNSGPYYSDPIPFTTGTFVGGVEPITYEYRHNEQEKEGDEWTKPTPYFTYDNTVTEQTLQIDGKSKAQAVKITCRATDAEGTIVYNNSPELNIYNPVPVITEEPGASSFNQYVVGEELVGFAGAFTGGAEGAFARARWRWRASKDDIYTGDVWTSPVESVQEVRSSPIPAGMIQVQFQYQVIEPGTSTGSGNRQTNKTTPAKDVVGP